MLKSPIRLLAVGCGAFALRHARSCGPIAEKFPDLFRIVGACDVDKASGELYSTKIAAFQPDVVPIYTDLSKALRELRPDVVDLVVPHNLHHTLAQECLEAGADVLLAKPVAITIALAQELIAVARRLGRTLAVSEQFRRSVAARTMYWAVNRVHLIGRPRMLYHLDVLSSPFLSTGPWRHSKNVGGGGWLLDFEVHTIDLMRYLFGEVAKVYGVTRHYDDFRVYNPKQILSPHTRGDLPPGLFTQRVSCDTEDAFSAILSFESGAVGTYSWAWSAPGRTIQVKRYYGAEGCLDDEGLLRSDGTSWTMAELQNLFRSRLTPEESERLFPGGITDPDAIAIHDFLTAVRDGRPPEIDATEALMDQAVAEAIYESAEAGQAASLENVLSGKLDAYQRSIGTHPTK